MIYKNFLAIIFISLVNYYIRNVFCLEADSIYGSYEANKQNFQFQVQIFGRKNFSNKHIPIGAGGIIRNDLVLTAAHIFVEIIDYLKVLSFVVTAGSNILQKPLFTIEVDVIYLANYNEITFADDIAVAKLKNKFNDDENTLWQKLRLPGSNYVISYNLAKVAGFGASDEIILLTNWFHGEGSQRNNQTTDSTEMSCIDDILLNFGIVRILYEGECGTKLEYFNTNKQICGIMIPKVSESSAGIVWGDTGSPLVINHVVVGIASTMYTDNNNNNVGVYLKVSVYKNFLDGVINNRPTRNTFVYYNRPHRL